MAPPQTQLQWTVQGRDGPDSWVLDKNAAVPTPGDKDVLVKFHAASLNFRDLLIAKGRYPFPTAPTPVPLCDGAGEVVAVGARVTRFSPGDRALPIFHQAHLAGSLDARSIATGVGSVVDGTLRQYGVFDENGLVRAPANLGWVEASTLGCAGVTAWNALFGVEGRALRAGEAVLTQGTGGVSCFAIQFAKAAGAMVIATTSSDEKAKKLKELGADHVINYKEEQNWGEVAKSFTPNKEGVSHVVEVGGPNTMDQSLKAVKIDGVISVVGMIGGLPSKQPSWLEILANICIVRGIYVGSRVQFEEMNRAIEINDIHPVVDEKVFTLEQAKDAYQYMWEKKHVGKVCIQIT